MKKLLLLFIFSSFFFSSYAQDVVLTKREQNAINLLKVTMFLQNNHGPVYLDHQEYQYRRDQEGSLLVIPIASLEFNDQMIGDNYIEYKIKTEGNTGLIELFKECKRYAFIRIDKWEGDRTLASGSRSLQDGKLMYDEKGRITGIDAGISYSRSGKKKIYRNTFYKIGYDAEGRLSEASKEVLYHKPSNSAEKLKAHYTFIEYSYKVEYKPNNVKLSFESFRKNDKNKALPWQNTVYHLKQKDFSSEMKKVANTHKKNGVKTSETLLTLDYDQDMRLTKKSSKSNNYTTTVNYIYDSQGNVIEEKHQSVNKENKIKTEDIIRKFDASGLVVYMEKVKNEDGKLKGKDIFEYNYTPAEGETEITKCKNKPNALMSSYDAEGQLFKESKDNKVRVKKNGVWGPWEHYRM